MPQTTHGRMAGLTFARLRSRVSGAGAKHWIKVKNRKHHAFARVQEAHSR
jgi:hypothetical protein